MTEVNRIGSVFKLNWNPIIKKFCPTNNLFQFKFGIFKYSYR